MELIFTASAGYSMKDGRSLVIDNVEASDAGVYVCVAQNNAGTALRQIRLQVKGDFPPVLSRRQLSLWDWPLTWKTIILQCYYTVGWVI